MCRSVDWATTLVRTEISQQLFDRVPFNCVQSFMVPRQRRLMTLVIPDFSSSATTRFTFGVLSEICKNVIVLQITEDGKPYIYTKSQYHQKF